MKKVVMLFLLAVICLNTLAEVPTWGQCGGDGWLGDTHCTPGSVCYSINPYYFQCQPAGDYYGTGCTTSCTVGGCGSSSCTITQQLGGGFGSSRSVSAQPGYYTCCIKDGWGNVSARCYPNSCCN